MLDLRTWEACLIDCTEGLDNIYENRSQTCRPKGKTYRYAQLGEFVHAVAVEHALEHEVACRCEPTGEKRGEGETATERQPPRASVCEATTSSRGCRLRVAETQMRRAKTPYLTHQMSKWFYDTSPGTAIRAACRGSLIGGTKTLHARGVSNEGTR
jgi:hypothetical protein